MELFRPKDVAAEQAGSRMGVGELPFEPHFGCISACFYTEWAFCVWICCTGLRFELGGGAGLFALFGLAFAPSPTLRKAALGGGISCRLKELAQFLR